MTQITRLSLGDHEREPKAFILDIPARHGEPGLTPQSHGPTSGKSMQQQDVSKIGLTMLLEGASSTSL